MRVQTSGLVNGAVGCPQAQLPICGNNDACGMKVPGCVYNSCVVSCASFPLLCPPSSRPHSRPRSYPRPRSHLRYCPRFHPRSRPRSILCSSTELHLVPVLVSAPSPFPSCVSLFASTPVPVPSPVPSPSPFTPRFSPPAPFPSPFPPPTAILPPIPYAPSHLSGPVTP